MEASHLIWTEEERRTVYQSAILSVRDTDCRSPEGSLKTFTVIDAADWVIIVPVLEDKVERTFLMVRQWRHGTRELSLEFPGGVLEEGESPAEGAGRELAEETAYRAGRIVPLGSMAPNPAIMSNRIHFFLAEDLQPLGHQNLDEDEFVDPELIPARTVVKEMGKAPYVHALTASALALYLSHTLILDSRIPHTGTDFAF